MQPHVAPLPVSSLAGASNLPRVAIGPAHVRWPTAGAGTPAAAPTVAGTVLESLEDVGLLLLVVLAVPAVIMLLALPLILLGRLAAYVGGTW